MVSVQGTDAPAERVLDSGDRTVDCEQTREGHRFVADDFETTVYWNAGYWQTTIPYWVELCGAVSETVAVRAAATDGLADVEV